MNIALPDNLNAFQKEAEQALEKGAVKDIEFSGPTYQVLIEDPTTSELFWVFLQLEGKDKIKDAFCSADHEMDDAGCLHIAIAYLSLFNDTQIPLHQRFSLSLWDHLCRLYESRLGNNPERLISQSPGKYIYESSSSKKLFEIEGLTPEAIEFLEKTIAQRVEETEETSIKFSNLTPEELSEWHEGKPRPHLRYHLSFWNDIAKWLMKKQEDKIPYKISFKYSKNKLPNWIQIDFEDVRAGYYISEANLPMVVESLNSVESPLPIWHSFQGEVERITYDKKEQVLRIHEKKGTKNFDFGKKKGQAKKEEVLFNGWKFVPEEGFYAVEPHELLKRPELYGEDIVHALTEHTRFISSLIENEHVFQEPIPLSYEVYFDERWNLHISAYLLERGDITTGDSWLMNNWVYIDGDGFYPVEGNRFHDAEIVVSVSNVSDFVTQNRAWFDTREGFHTHVKSIEFQLNYQVANRRLQLIRDLEKSTENVQQQDFGKWVYVEGSGFYPKTGNFFNSLLRPGISLSAEQIPLFIRMNREELAFIPRFFSDRCPVKKAGLNVELIDSRKVKVTPEYELEKTDKEKLQLFDDFTYVVEEGFYELPIALRLPEAFRHPVEIEGEELLEFLNFDLEDLKPYISHLDSALIKPQELKLGVNFIEQVLEKGRGWYRISLYYQTERGVFSVNALKPYLKKKFYYVFLEAGLLDLRSGQFDWLKELPKERFEKKTLLINTLEFMKLNAYFPIEIFEKDIENVKAIDQKSKETFEGLLNFQTPEKPDMGGLISHLRPYQEMGVLWLWFIYRHQLSALLCDDMGLGKTHQAMALMASVRNLYLKFAEGSKHHYLIVCPTSVLYHWEDKLNHYFPGLRVCSFYGAKRDLSTFTKDYDVLLTSYGVLRNESEALSKINFEIAIFDEIHIAKNQFSRVYATLSKIKAQMKVGMTGTPIENRLRELKSLFDIVLPSYMPADSQYREYFIKPIEKENDVQKKEVLGRLIRPFVLRRKKEDVLKELPEKIEEISYCDLKPDQELLYSDVLEQRRRQLLEELQDKTNPIPYLHIFALLSSLKQICDHPAVYFKTPSEYQNFTSGKWDLFIELIREARESGQKIVVFTQYLAMLDIIEGYLESEKIGFASIRGATQDRREQLKKFNTDPECEVFVGSLQAAGLGIDLTAGSVVIHYDRWWNAARENQATDRVHRIGQKRGVQVFKLVTKGTFEEKINAMIDRKRKLMEEVVGVDDHETTKTFSRDELMQLLELVKTDMRHPLESDEF